MPLWKNQGDNASNSDIAAVMQYNKNTTTANQTELFANTTPDVYAANLIVGQFGVGTGEAQANPSIGHSGWVLRKEGTGGRAGRVTYEVLVAMGSLSGDASDDTYMPDYRLYVTTQPSACTAPFGSAVSFRVVAASAPSGSLTYKWQSDGGPSSQTWADIANTGVYQSAYGNNSATLAISNNALLTGNTYRVIITKTGANTVYSSNAVLTMTPYVLSITQQPSNANGAANVSISSNAASSPAGAVLTYKWQQSYAGAASWADIPNTAGVWFNNTSPTLIANAAVANANTIRMLVMSPGSTTINTSNVIISTP